MLAQHRPLPKHTTPVVCTQVVIDPPSTTDTVSILRGLRARLERHHNVSACLPCSCACPTH